MIHNLLSLIFLMVIGVIFVTPKAYAQENYPMMLTVQLNNGSQKFDKMEILKINTMLKKVPAPRPFEVQGYHHKSDSYAIFIKDYRVGQAVEDSKAIYPFLRQELLKLYPKATFDLLHFTFAGELQK